jgi:hypothetical protein
MLIWFLEPNFVPTLPLMSERSLSIVECDMLDTIPRYAFWRDAGPLMAVGISRLA